VNISTPTLKSRFGNYKKQHEDQRNGSSGRALASKGLEFKPQYSKGKKKKKQHDKTQGAWLFCFAATNLTLEELAVSSFCLSRRYIYIHTHTYIHIHLY
jgi:hypothetical protein